jgi:hypothetical protein
MNNIHVFNNFISSEDSLALIDHIELNIDTFNTGVLKLYHQQMFGHNPLSKTSNKISDYPVVASIANSAFSKAINSSNTFY